MEMHVAVSPPGVWLKCWGCDSTPTSFCARSASHGLRKAFIRTWMPSIETCSSVCRGCQRVSEQTARTVAAGVLSDARAEARAVDTSRFDRLVADDGVGSGTVFVFARAAAPATGAAVFGGGDQRLLSAVSGRLSACDGGLCRDVSIARHQQRRCPRWTRPPSASVTLKDSARTTGSCPVSALSAVSRWWPTTRISD